MKHPIRATIVALLGAGIMAAPAGATPAPAASSGVTTSTVGGSWIQAVNCIYTSFDPSDGAFTCLGSSTWEGAWTGLTHYDATGTYNPTTGDMRGTLEETFVGTYVPDHSRGTLRFHETFVIDGATSALHIETQILGGDGDPSFHCSSGHITFDGLTPGPTGFGGYRGTWVHGCG